MSIIASSRACRPGYGTMLLVAVRHTVVHAVPDDLRDCGRHLTLARQGAEIATLPTR
jgi:hypothetical protein